MDYRGLLVLMRLRMTVPFLIGNNEKLKALAA